MNDAIWSLPFASKLVKLCTSARLAQTAIANHLLCLKHLWIVDFGPWNSSVLTPIVTMIETKCKLTSLHLMSYSTFDSEWIKLFLDASKGLETFECILNTPFQSPIEEFLKSVYFSIMAHRPPLLEVILHTPKHCNIEVVQGQHRRITFGALPTAQMSCLPNVCIYRYSWPRDYILYIDGFELVQYTSNSSGRISYN
ncbi:hypothetical protein GYMLUDRAFT_60087 [Collybiopsis luxurians FD-317 M1]|uniref:Uncharacterized protein n=1 Tax=Collybiopsis luxurians FD-317 M1 TaxID=944289 RepID=A0A0D0B7T2_9AGAR|nr:hypothetical protein GYMLUDRAFT_60087 [Collybiopsis luxurians FD-317 M1]